MAGPSSNPSLHGYSMAPTLKEADSSVATSATTAPGSPLAKSPTETPSRPQPVAIEIPVTVNGARTVEGSDKREPFSETTQTVLVFAQGAVVRITTPLAPGQLIFLTNEKSKKEVVCQVLKSKSGGSTGAYVELQFTEPAPSFWGLKTQGGTGAAAPAVSRPAPPAPPIAPKGIPPAVPEAAKPETPKSVSPVAPVLSPVKPEMVPPPPPAAHREPSGARPVALETPPPSVFAAPPPPVAVTAEPPATHAAAPEPVSPTPSQPPATLLPPAPILPKLVTPAAPIGDYSQEIQALFASPHAPAHQAVPQKPAEEKPSTASSAPSSEELKLQAARLQAQLGSMLFTETPATPPAALAIPPASKTDPSLTEVAKKVVEISHEAPSSAPKLEPKPALPARKPSAPSLSMDDEVKIPAWLAPLSQNSEPSASAKPVADEASSLPESDALASDDESSAVTLDSSHRETAVFAGQLLGESSGQQEHATTAGSKKGLLIGLAATVLLAGGAGAWYYRQTHAAATPAVPVHAANVPFSSGEIPVSTFPAANSTSTPTVNLGNTASNNPPPVSAQPLKNASSVSNAAPATLSPAPKNPNPVAANPTPAESPKKGTLGDVHLEAPVVNRGAATSSEGGEPLPSIGTTVPSSGAEELAAIASSHRSEPVAPVPVGGDVKPARLVKSVPPIYPAVAKSQRLSGDVQIDALIDESGDVSAVKVLSGPTLLHRAALDAVKQWKYTPAMLDGKTTSMHLTVTVQFRTQ